MATASAVSVPMKWRLDTSTCVHASPSAAVASCSATVSSASCARRECQRGRKMMAMPRRSWDCVWGGLTARLRPHVKKPDGAVQIACGEG
eukprot:296048-Chlamydomonas_euryale.AAC.1